MMAIYALSHPNRRAALLFWGFLALYAAGGVLGGAGFRPAVAAQAQATDSAYVELAVADVELAADTVSWLVSRYDGQVTDNYHWAEPGERWASLTAQLPARNFDSFYRELAAVGLVRAERMTRGTGNTTFAGTAVTVLLVGPYPAPAARVVQPPVREPVEPIATWRPSSPLQAAWIIGRSLYQALVAVLSVVADLVGPALIVALALIWLFWHSQRRVGK